MSYKITYTQKFDKEIKRLNKKYSSLKYDLDFLINRLKQNPSIIGTYIGDGMYKTRMAIKSKAKGKSGGARVNYEIDEKNKIVSLVFIYDKNEYSNLDAREIRELTLRIMVLIMSLFRT